MKPLYLLLLTLTVSTSSLFAQSNGPHKVMWKKSFGGSKDDKANVVIRAYDNGFFVAGSSLSNNGDITGHHGGTDSSDAWLVKLSANGDLQWQRSYGGAGVDEFKSIIPTSDGNYICFGTTTSNDGDVSGKHGQEDIWVVKIDRYGAILWQKCLGGSKRELAGNIRENSDGSYYLIGSTISNDGDVSDNISPGSSFPDIWVVKLSAAGNILWQRCLGGSNIDYGFDIAESDAGFIVAVQADSPDGTFAGIQGNPPYGIVAKFNATDSIYLVWSNVSFRAYSKSLTPLGNNEFATVNDVMDCYPVSPRSGTRARRFKDSLPYFSGAPAFSQMGGYGLGGCISNNYVYGYQYDGPHGYTSYNGLNHVTVGTYDSSIDNPDSEFGDLDGFIGTYNTDGSNIKRKFIGGPGKDYLLGALALDETSFLVTGYSNSTSGDVSGNKGGYDFWIVKMGAVNIIKGTVYADYNLNGSKDAGEPFVNNQLVQAVKGSTQAASSTYQGQFSLVVDTGAYTISMQTVPQWYTAVPAQFNSSHTNYGNTDSFSFALQPVPGNRDYRVQIFSRQTPRPGFATSYEIRYENSGTDTLQNRMVTWIKDSRLSFVNATPAPTSISGDTVRWNIASLSPRQTGIITINASIAAPPIVSIGDTLRTTALIDSTGDLVPSNNVSITRELVFGSYDPNDKLEAHGGFLLPEELATGKPLVYTIRFQNTGTDTAFNIIVRDTLQAKLDPATLEMIDASHPYQLSIQNGRYLTWTFSNILLVDSNRNEPLSHGFISYRIRPVAGLAVGDTVKNGASIYFDFNLPVHTNIATTVVRADPPATPVVTGIQADYCSAGGVKTGKITNLPANGSGITVTVKIDGNTVPVAADSTFSFNVSTLAAGAHNILVQFSNTTANRTSSSGFNITAAVTPDVNVSANITNITSLATPVIVTGTNAAGGGAVPLYTFARDRNFTNITKAESVENTWTFDPSILTIGDNWIYVRMKSSANCVVMNTVVDSIKMVRSSVTGITDPDMPGHTINIYPNPFNDVIMIDGLSPAKTYTVALYNLNGQQLFSKRLSNRTSMTFDRQYPATGTYWLSIYDEKQKRLLGTVKLVRQ